MKAAMTAGWEKMEAVIISIQFEFEDNISEWVEGVLVSVDQWTHSFHMELSNEIQGTKRDLHEEFADQHTSMVLRHN
jgi:hypothetical protein